MSYIELLPFDKKWPLSSYLKKGGKESQREYV